MNTTTDSYPNYPFLSGWLESELKNIAYNAQFVKLDVQERMDHVHKIIAEARKEAIKYQNTIGN